MLIKDKLTRPHLERFFALEKSSQSTLILHPEGPFARYFPNHTLVSDRAELNPDLLVGRQYEELAQLPGDSYPVIVCAGLLEHIAAPAALIDELYRILQPGGKLILTASAVFSFHGGKNNYFHFTPGGLQLLFSRWERVQIRGASQPFENVAILLQRILFQCQIPWPVRKIVTLLCLVLPLLDRFVGKQYCSAGKKSPELEVDSMMPSSLQLVAFK